MKNSANHLFERARQVLLKITWLCNLKLQISRIKFNWW